MPIKDPEASKLYHHNYWKNYQRKDKGSKSEDLLRQTKTRLAGVEAQVKRLHKANDTAESIRQEIYGLKALKPSVPTWLIGQPDSSVPGVPMTIWSDWHWGESIFKAQTGGVNEYNTDIAKERVQKLIFKTISLTKKHMVNPQYPGIVVCLAGDIITGAIHEDLYFTNCMTVQQAVLDVEETLIWAFKELLKEFDNIFVPCVVGNHGRDTMKPRFKNTVFQSYEWNLYTHLDLYFRDEPRIRFLIPEETDAHFKVFDHSFTLTHGDNLGVKGGDGIIGAIGPIARGASKMGRSEAQIGRDFNTLLMGHWHTYIPRGDAIPVVVNGCLCGYNEYARLKLRVPYSRPSQALWFVHQKHGFTASWPVYVDDIHYSEDSMSWVEWLRT